MLKLTDVSAGYDGKNVLHNVSFSLQHGQSLSILGPNSCGKTTLIRAIAALIKSEGSITLDGRDIKTMKRKDIAAKIAVMSQISSIYFPYTVYETVMLGRYQHMRSTMFGTPSDKDRAVVEKCLETTDVSSIRDKLTDSLSGGQLQRVFLAHTLAQEPQLILLDEPTNHLDIKHQIELVSYLNEWSKTDNHAVIGVFHDINLALGLSENVLFLKDGNIMGMGNASTLINREFLKNIYDIDIMEYMLESYGRWNSFRKAEQIYE
ncbi:MAG: ABC transporter ATP-binding protein [Clostridiales bacterium]|nr:ABC transporter ATP-binding protein [Clostridiales bacterium]